MRLRKVGAWIFGTIAVLVLFLILISFFIDEPLRRYMEREVNHRLKGYTVRIGRLDFHPIGFSLDLADFVLIQNAHPTPPLAEIRKLSASIQWRAAARPHRQQRSAGAPRRLSEPNAGGAGGEG